MTNSSYSRAAVLAASMLALTVGVARAQAKPACAADPHCAEVREFVATVADFRPSAQGSTRLVTATVRFQNKTKKPLLLGYVQSSGIVTDDRDNRYVVYGAGAVRGIGEVTANAFDPKFVLQPGETSDARFEFMWKPSAAGQIYGTTYEMDLAIREIDPVAGDQYKLGKEHTLHFKNFGAPTKFATGPKPGSGDVPATPEPASTDPAPDVCKGSARCYTEGPFMAEVTQLTPIAGGRHHLIKINLKIKNISSEPLILGYASGTSSAIDNLGNRYAYGRPSTHDGSFQGIGLVTGRSADPQFALRPGESRTAVFQVIRYESGNKELGTSWSYDVSLTQLEVLPSRQIRSVRSYSVSFHDLTPGASAGQSGRNLVDQLRKKIQKSK